MITEETLESMADDEFDIYLEERKRLKPHLDRYYLEDHWKTIPYEEWLKIELRDDKLKELLNEK